MKKLFVLIFLVLSFVSRGQNIITVAGTGANIISGNGGQAVKAGIAYIGYIAFDLKGNYYFTNTDANIVWKVSTSGIISIIAGNGTAGFSGDGGPATSAELNQPSGIAVDKHCNIYISDGTNNRVRKVDTNGIITTIAGNGYAGFSGDSDLATNASLNYPSGLAVDSHGYIYICDHINFRVRRIDTTGIITTYAGNGTMTYSGDGGDASIAGIFGPYSLAMDKYDNLYMACNFDQVRKIDSRTHIITAFAGNGLQGYSGDGGHAISAEFFLPSGIAVDNIGNVYIGDLDNNRIRKVDTAGYVHTVVGTGMGGFGGDGGPAILANIHNPSGAAFDQCGNLYFSDLANARVRVVIYDTSFNVVTPTIIASPDNAVCAHTQISFQANATVHCGVPVYQWIKNGVNVGSNNSIYTDTPANGDSIRCIVTYGASISTNTIIMQVAPVDTPKISIKAINPVCSGTPVTFTATHTGGGVAPSYEWIKNGTIVSGAAGYSYTYTPNNRDSVRCLLYASDDDLCAIKPVSSNTIDMMVNPTLKPVVTISSPAVANPGSTVSLTATITNAGSSYRIEWKNHGIIFSTTTVPNTSYIKTVGLDTITATVIPMAQACFDSTTSAFITVRTGDNAGVANIASGLGLDIYPNPTNDMLHIDHVTTSGNYTLFNILGVTVQQGILQAGNNNLSIQTLPQGIYLLEITDEERTIKKIVKQ